MKNKEKITANSRMDQRLTVGASLYAPKISAGALFAISFIYLYWFGNSIFFFQENRSLFIYSGEYLLKYLAKPGGLLSYSGVFLTQVYFSSLYGALVNSILIVLIFLIFNAINKRLAARGSLSLLINILPSVLTLLMLARYEFDLQVTMGFLLVALLFLFSISSDGKYLDTISFILIPIFYYLAGSFALIYLGMSISYILIHAKGRKRILLPLLLAADAVITFLLFKEILFIQPVKILLGYPLVFNENIRLTSYLLIPGVIYILYPSIIRISELIRLERYFRLLQLVTMLILFPILICILARQYNPSIVNMARIEKSVQSQDWESVIRQYERIQTANIVSQFYYNLALSETGQLCSRMFSGPQNYGPFSVSLEGNREQASRTMYFYYAIGLINEAHHLAYELMVQNGYTPENLKMLIKTELIRGNLRVARRYTDILKKTMHYKGWVMKYERMLNNPGLITSDPELGIKFRLMPREDFFITTNDSKNIDLLLKSNPGNRIAFEYKIARSLLDKDIIAVVEESGKLKELGYNSIPKHIGEAAIAYMNYALEIPDLRGLKVNRETELHFIQYQRVIGTFRGDKSLIEKNIKKSERNTFWYYLQFSTLNSDFLKSRPADNSIY